MKIHQIMSILIMLLPLSSLSSTFPSRKFESFFNQYSQHFESSSTITCNATLQEYLRAKPSLDDKSYRVAEHADCILANTTETIKSNMASASVILGLMPSILSNFGPTQAESSVLMLERPILAALLAVGGPAMYLSRPFDYYEPLAGLDRLAKRFPSALTGIRASVAVDLAQYILATCAALNVVTASLELGMKTVTTWNKENSYHPLTWALLPVLIHLCATITLRYSLEKVPAPNSRPNVHQRLINLFGAKHSICTHTLKSSVAQQEEPYIIYFLSICLPILNLMHLAFGIIVFSSLLFIAVHDTLAIVVRYGISAGVVQLLRNFEISRLRGACGTGVTQRRNTKRSRLADGGGGISGAFEGTPKASRRPKALSV